MNKVTGIPHPSPLVPCRPKSFQPIPVPLFRSCAALLSCPVLSCHCQNGNGTQTERKRKGTDGRRPKAKGTKGTERRKERNAQPRKERNTGTHRNQRPTAGRKPETKGKRRERPSFLPFLPFPAFLPFPSFSCNARTKGKNIFVSKKPFFASFRPFYFRSYKLGKINL